MCLAFSSRGMFSIVLYDENLDPARYCRVLEEGLLETDENLSPICSRLVHNNVTCH